MLIASVAGCAQEGDFGRPRAGAWNSLVDTTGSFSTRDRGRLVAEAVLTDDERTLRDRAWHFLAPESPRATFLTLLAALAEAHAPPADWRMPGRDTYHANLMAEPFRSPISRYRRLVEDAGTDTRLIPAFAGLAARVSDADGQRLRSLPFARTLDAADVRQAALKVAENRCLIAWVRLETGLRLERYRYALEHLFAEAPGLEAIQAERVLAMLSDRRALLDPLLPPDAAIRCGLETGAAVAQANTPAPLVTKN